MTGPKKITLFLLFSIFLWSFPAQAQETRDADSLIQLISVQDDSPEKVENILTLTSILIRKDPSRAIGYCEQALDISKKINYTAGISEGHYSMSQIYKTTGILDSSMASINKHIASCLQYGDSINLAKGYMQLGNLVRRQGENNRAFEYYLKSNKIYKNLHDTLGLISANNALGIIFKNNAQYDSAASYYHQTLQLCQKINCTKGIGPTLINLGKVYMMMKNYEQARTYTLQSLSYSKANDNLKHVALAYTNLGNISYKLNNYSEAERFYLLAAEIQSQLQNTIGLNNLYINLGNIHQQQAKLQQALQNFDKALVAFQNIGYAAGTLTASINKALVLADLKMYDDAILWLDSSLSLARQIKDRDAQAQIYKHKYKLFTLLGDFENALIFHEKYYRLRDSIFSQDTKNTLAELSLKYEKEKDQASILALSNENLAKNLSLRKRTNQRNIYLFVGSASLVTLLFILLFYRIRTHNEKLLAQQKIIHLQNDKKLLEAKALIEGQEKERKRIAKELHDGIGVFLSAAKMQLSSIIHTTPNNKSQIHKVTKIIEQANSDVRKITHNMMPGLLTKYGFFEAIEDLVEHLDESNTLKARLRITGQRHRYQENCEIMLYRIIQELVNNTLKHAGARAIEIVVEILPPALQIIYCDDGVGFNPEEIDTQKALGLTSIRSRVSFLGGSISIHSTPKQGVTFNIRIAPEAIKK